MQPNTRASFSFAAVKNIWIVRSKGKLSIETERNFWLVEFFFEEVNAFWSAEVVTLTFVAKGLSHVRGEIENFFNRLAFAFVDLQVAFGFINEKYVLTESFGARDLQKV